MAAPRTSLSAPGDRPERSARASATRAHR